MQIRSLPFSADIFVDAVAPRTKTLALRTLDARIIFVRSRRHPCGSALCFFDVLFSIISPERTQARRPCLFVLASITNTVSVQANATNGIGIHHIAAKPRPFARCRASSHTHSHTKVNTHTRIHTHARVRTAACAARNRNFTAEPNQSGNKISE